MNIKTKIVSAVIGVALTGSVAAVAVTTNMDSKRPTAEVQSFVSSETSEISSVSVSSSGTATSTESVQKAAISSAASKVTSSAQIVSKEASKLADSSKAISSQASSISAKVARTYKIGSNTITITAPQSLSTVSIQGPAGSDWAKVLNSQYGTGTSSQPASSSSAGNSAASANP